MVLRRETGVGGGGGEGMASLPSHADARIGSQLASCWMWDVVGLQLLTDGTAAGAALSLDLLRERLLPQVARLQALASSSTPAPQAVGVPADAAPAPAPPQA